MDTLRRSRTFTAVLTASCEVHIHEEAQVFVHDFYLSLTLQFMKICQRTVRFFMWVLIFQSLSDCSGTEPEDELEADRSLFPVAISTSLPAESCGGDEEDETLSELVDFL